jgi:hypothetical protein
VTDRAERYVLALVSSSPNLLIPHYLIACFMYYVEDAPVLTDEGFDFLVAQVQERWESLQHPHKGLLDPSLLKSGFHLKYPAIVEGAAGALRARLARG